MGERMKKIVMIGYGAMAQAVMPLLPEDVNVGWLVVMPQDVAKTQAIVGDEIKVISRISEIDGQPDCAVEMAGQLGLQAHLFDLIRAGIDVGVISVGTFADSVFQKQVEQAAKEHQVKISILSGAIAGIDGLASAKLAGLDSVLYQGRKNPRSWKGSYAEELVDLDQLENATTFFKGSAREAAQRFPANANVAATLALAGIGMDDTEVELIADPKMERNQHKIIAQGKFGAMEIVMMGVPLESNPKTSMLAALSVARFCRQLDDALLI
ncbi:putative L-aspartate dehydrogenase [Ignatzschineria indica]|nr:putative L-aspartate dehydrogenase [Ignatzschineria indica]